ncbi:MAG: PAS domain S-box protein [Burkholderiales bacterium]
MNSSGHPHPRHLVEWVAIAAAVLLSASVVVAAWLSYHSYRATEYEFALHHAEDVVQLLQANARSTMLSADDVVRRLKRVVERDGLNADIARLLQEASDIKDIAAVVSVADAQGRLVLSNLPIPPGAGIADLEHFRVHVERDTGLPFVNKPVLGRVSGKWSFHLTRRINGPGGSFGGVAIVAVDLSYWDGLLQQEYFGKAEAFALVGRDGAARAAFWRNPAGRQTLMQADWTFLAQAVGAGAKRAGRVVAPAAGGVTSGVWAYRAVENFPLIVAVRVDEENTAARLGVVRAWYVGGAIMLVILIVILTAGLLSFLSRQRLRAAEAVRVAGVVRQSEELYRQLFDANPLPVLIRDENSLDILAVNQAMVDKYGYTREQFSRMTTVELLSSGTQDDYIREVAARPADAESKARRTHVLNGGTEIEVDIVTRPFEFNGKGARLLVINDMTEKVRSEHMIRESEQRFRAIFDHAGIGITMRFLHDRHRPWEVVNDRICEMTGYRREELLRMSTADLTMPEEQGAAISDNNRLLRGEITSYERDKRLRCKDGGFLWVRLSVAALPDADGRVNRVIATYQDINARKLAEERLRDSENRLRAIIAAEPECVATVAPDGTLLEMNPAGLRMLGAASLAEMQRKPVIRHVAAEYRRAFIGLHRRILAGSAGMLEFEATGPGGKRVWLEIHAVPLYGASGAVAELLGIARDVTERRQAREALAAERNLLRTVIDNIPDPIRVRDRNLDTILANEAWRRAGASDRDSAAGHAGQGQDRGSGWFNDEDRAVLATGRPSIPREREEGTAEDPRWFVTTKSPLRDAGGGVIGVVSISRDVTDYRRRSLEVEKLNTALERRVAERTAQLSNANEELEAFAASISHDLRAPLRNLDGLAAGLIEDHGATLDPAGQHMLGRIRAVVARMGGLIEDLLRLSRVARAELALQEVSLSDLAQSIIDDLRRDQPDRHVDVRIESGLHAMADPGLLRSALMNLLHNAWKFTGNTPDALIEVGSLQLLGNTAYYVRDNGVGFNMEHADRLFGAFQRLHTDREFPGTGVGLATVRRVMRRHGGDAWAEAAAARGAIFFFTLSGGIGANRKSSREPGATAPQAHRPEADDRHARRTAVLLVDDDQDALALAMHSLRSDGYELLTADSGEAAIEILGKRAVNVIVSDFSMPGMNGAQLLAQAARLHPATLRIILSGQTQNRAMQAGLSSGEIHHYFEKQHSFAPVRKCIRDWLAPGKRRGKPRK